MPKSERIPVGKKRYTLTLTEKNMEGFQAYLKSKNAPRSLLSGVIDEFLGNLCQTMQQLEAAQQRKGEVLGLGELLTIMGGVMTETSDKQGRLTLHDK